MKILFQRIFHSSGLMNFTIFLGGGLVFWLVAPLQADPHHDGVILAPAIAYSEGLPLHAGAFSQYGPLSPLISGLWLRLTDANLLSLRHFAALQAVTLSIGLYLVLKEFISENRSRTLVAVWIFASGIWSTRFPGALMAWPSLLSSCILIFALLLSILAIKRKTRFTEVQLASAGFLIAIAGFARAQSWIIAASIGLVLVLKGTSSLKKILALCAGYIFGLITILGIVNSGGGINDWWLQSIYWPTQIYPALGEGNNYNRFQMVLYLIESLLLVSIVILTGWISKRLSRVTSVIFLLMIVLTCLLLGYWIPTMETVPIRFRVLFGEPFERVLVSPFYLATLAAVILVLFEIRKKKINRNDQTLLVSSFGALSIIQLYPQSDVMHLWWIAPLIIPSLAIGLVEIKKFKPFWEESFYRSMKVFSVCGIILAFSFITSDWKEYDNQAFKGTFAGTEKVNSLRIYNKISEYSIEKKSSFDCTDGVYSVINGSYGAVDQWYVNWGFTDSVKPKSGKVRFICGKSLEYAESEALRLGWKVVEFTRSSTNPEISLAILKPLSQN